MYNNIKVRMGYIELVFFPIKKSTPSSIIASKV